MVLLLNCDSNLADVSLRSVVELTVVENELHVLHELLNFLILVFLELCFYL